MAITAQALAPLPSGAPTLGVGQPAQGPGDAQEPFVVGVASFTGDGATTAAVLNWIDGTLTLPFTPTAVLVFGTYGGSDTTGVLRAEGSNASKRVTAISSTSATINFSTAIANAVTFQVIVLAFK